MKHEQLINVMIPNLEEFEKLAKKAIQQANDLEQTLSEIHRFDFEFKFKQN